jgi:hypothetical protein
MPDAPAEKTDAAYVIRVLRLMLLVPDIVEAILDGRQGERAELWRLLRGFPVPLVFDHALAQRCDGLNCISRDFTQQTLSGSLAKDGNPNCSSASRRPQARRLWRPASRPWGLTSTTHRE